MGADRFTEGGREGGREREGGGRNSWRRHSISACCSCSSSPAARIYHQSTPAPARPHFAPAAPASIAVRQVTLPSPLFCFEYLPPSAIRLVPCLFLCSPPPRSSVLLRALLLLVCTLNIVCLVLCFCYVLKNWQKNEVCMCCTSI